MEQKNPQLKELCKECLLHNKNLHHCPFCNIDFSSNQSTAQALKKLNNISLRANTILNHNKRNTELLFFDEEFSIAGNKSPAPRRRLFYFDTNFEAIRAIDPQNPKSTITNFLNTRHKNHKRALNSFLNYGQNNDWEYFFTITFDPRKINSTDQQAVKYAWKLFRQKLQYNYPDIQIMCVVEYHKDGSKLHFHGVIAIANIDSILSRAVNMQLYRKDKHGNIIMRNNQPVQNKLYLQPLLSNIGDKIYNFKPTFYQEGFCSVIPLTDRTNDLTVYEKVVFYLAKYMAKDKSAVPFNGKSFFRTHILDKGTKECIYLSEQEFQELLSNENFTLKKSTARFSSYISRTSRVEFLTKIKRAWHQMADGITVSDIATELDTILADDDLDPIFSTE